jgi:hypothetical protein
MLSLRSSYSCQNKLLMREKLLRDLSMTARKCCAAYTLASNKKAAGNSGFLLLKTCSSYSKPLRKPGRIPSTSVSSASSTSVAD